MSDKYALLRLAPRISAFDIHFPCLAHNLCDYAYSGKVDLLIERVNERSQTFTLELDGFKSKPLNLMEKAEAIFDDDDFLRLGAPHIEDVLLALQYLVEGPWDKETLDNATALLSEACDELARRMFKDLPDELFTPLEAYMFRLILDGQPRTYQLRMLNHLGQELSVDSSIDWRLDEQTFSLTAAGRVSCVLGNVQAYWLLKALMDKPGRYVQVEDLAERMGEDARNIKVAKHRLLNALERGGLGDFARLIRSQRGHYGYFPDGETGM